MRLNPFFVSSLLIFLLISCLDKQSDKSIEKELYNSNLEVKLELKTDAKLGEGAFWDSATQTLFWVDILEKRLCLYHPESQANTVLYMPSRIGTVVPQTDSSAVVALEDGIYLKEFNSPTLIPLSDIEASKTENRFNDGKVDPNGNLWVGSMNLAETDPTGALYKVSPEGNATKMLENITISNGLVWTKDASTFYYIDTPTMKIRAFDFDTSTNTISNERVAVEVSEELGFPDGMAIDSEDKLWVAMWNGNAVVRFDPDSGEVLQKIEVPAHNVTSCAFGGPELDILYITTASVDMTEEEHRQYPLAGSLFSVRPGVKGVVSPRFGTSN